MDKEDRSRIWWLYGRFSGLMTCGSCFGIVAWSADMLFLVNNFEANGSRDIVQVTLIQALSYRWRCVFLVTYVTCPSHINWKFVML
jgi:hypothetical protein